MMRPNQGGSGETEWDSKKGGMSVEEEDDETVVALLPDAPLPDDHHLHIWMRAGFLHKAELALFHGGGYA
jgi:hypothetical protein